jgi:hypothetical protein
MPPQSSCSVPRVRYGRIDAGPAELQDLAREGDQRRDVVFRRRIEAPEPRAAGGGSGDRCRRRIAGPSPRSWSTPAGGRPPRRNRRGRASRWPRSRHRHGRPSPRRRRGSAAPARRRSRPRLGETHAEIARAQFLEAGIRFGRRSCAAAAAAPCRLAGWRGIGAALRGRTAQAAGRSARSPAARAMARASASNPSSANSITRPVSTSIRWWWWPRSVGS